MHCFQSACRFLSNDIKQCLYALPVSIIENAVEIVLKVNAPLFVVCKQNLVYVGSDGYYSMHENSLCHIVTQTEIRNTVLRSCGYSLSAHNREIEQGFISLGNGCRMSIASAAGPNKNALYARDLFLSLRIRIARNIRIETKDFFCNGKIISSLLVGQPASGKTTILRNLICDLAEGVHSKRYRVCVIDERNEIYPRDVPRPACVDVIAGIDKHIGINRAVRLCMPEIVICDEIGTVREANTVLQTLNSGVVFVCSMHAQNLEELHCKPCFKILAEQNVFQRLLLLEGSHNPGHIREVISISENTDEVDFGDFVELSADFNSSK